MDYEKIPIKIIDFDSYSHKKDIKYKSYLVIRFNIINSPEFIKLKGDELRFFLMILSYAIPKGNDVVTINLAHYCGLLNHSLADCKLFLNSLESNNFIELQRKIRINKQPHTLHNITYITDNTEHENPDGLNPPPNDFVMQVVNIWNAGCVRHGLSQITTNGKTWIKRKKTLSELCRHYKNADDWKGIFAVASEKGFSKPDGYTFKPNFDYALRKADLFFEESNEGQDVAGVLND